MKMMMVVALLALAGCAPYYQQPASPAQQQFVDNAVAAGQRCQQGDQASCILFDAMLRTLTPRY
jgi:hypothetical protein